MEKHKFQYLTKEQYESLISKHVLSSEDIQKMEDQLRDAVKHLEAIDIVRSLTSPQRIEARQQKVFQNVLKSL